MSRILILTALLALIYSVQAKGQEENIRPDTLRLEEINVTASKIPLSSRQTTKNVILISRKEIEQSASRSVAQLLNSRSGIIVNNAFSNRSANQNIYLQGADNEYTLLLIDGVPVSDPAGIGGALDLRVLPLSGVERIEIVKGSQSTLYGTNAIAGVINIITRESEPSLFNADGSLSYGSFNTLNATANVSGSGDGFGYLFNYGYEGSEGISEAENPGNAGDFDKDGINSNAFFAKVFFEPVNGLTITPTLNYSYFESEFDGGSFTDADNDLSLELINPGLNAKYERGSFELNALYGYTETNNAFFTPTGATPFKTEGRSQNADIYASGYIGGKIQLLGGFAYQNFETVGSTGGFDANIISPYTTLFFRNYDGLNAELGIRLNEHSEFGSQLTYNISPSYNLLVGNDVLDDIKLQASLSTGFRAPTLNDLFGPFGSNINLKPEESRSIDGSITARMYSQKLELSLLYFNRRIDNLIIFDAATLALTNVNQQEDQGIESSISYRFNQRYQLRAFYNWLEGKIMGDAGGEESNLIRRPENRLGLSLNALPVKGLSANVQWIYSSSRDDLFFDPVTFAQSEVNLDPYHLLNMFAEYSLAESGISIFVDLRNLLDQDYNEVVGFNAPGIHGNIGIRIRLN